MMLIVSLYSLGAALISAGDVAAARQALNEALQRLLLAQYPFFTVIAFYYFAELLVLEGRAANLPLALARKSLAVALLTCVRSQSAAWQIYRDKAAQLQAQIADALPAEMLATAIAHGQRCPLEEMASSLLGDQADSLIDDAQDTLFSGCAWAVSGFDEAAGSEYTTLTR
jgi:hypothetical protein